MSVSLKILSRKFLARAEENKKKILPRQAAFEWDIIRVLYTYQSVVYPTLDGVKSRMDPDLYHKIPVTK